jgi:hypothetical protein
MKKGQKLKDRYPPAWLAREAVRAQPSQQSNLSRKVYFYFFFTYLLVILVAKEHHAERQWLDEQLNIRESDMFQQVKQSQFFEVQCENI